MPHQLSDPAQATALRALRVMFPHDGLPDEAYAKVVDALEPADDDGLERWLAGLDPDAVAAEEGSVHFELLRSTAVVELYDNPLVWKAFGYEGPSVHLGGYVDRGFDDLDWLPDPPVALDPAAGSHHRQEGLTA
jgi:hypothetical protein